MKRENILTGSPWEDKMGYCRAVRIGNIIEVSGTVAIVDGDKVNEDSNEIFKKVDFGWSLGIGKKFKINEKNKLSVELRDNLGLQNISDVPVQGNGTVKTNSFNLILGYEFNL